MMGFWIYARNIPTTLLLIDHVEDIIICECISDICEPVYIQLLQSCKYASFSTCESYLLVT